MWTRYSLTALDDALGVLQMNLWGCTLWFMDYGVVDTSNIRPVSTPYNLSNVLEQNSSFLNFHFLGRILTPSNLRSCLTHHGYPRPNQGHYLDRVLRQSNR